MQRLLSTTDRETLSAAAVLDQDPQGRRRGGGRGGVLRGRHRRALRPDPEGRVRPDPEPDLRAHRVGLDPHDAQQRARARPGGPAGRRAGSPSLSRVWISTTAPSSSAGPSPPGPVSGTSTSPGHRPTRRTTRPRSSPRTTTSDVDGTALCEGPSAVHRLIDCLQVERGQRMGTTRVTNRTVGFTEVSNAAPVSSFAVAAGSCGCGGVPAPQRGPAGRVDHNPEQLTQRRIGQHTGQTAPAPRPRPRPGPARRDLRRRAPVTGGSTNIGPLHWWLPPVRSTRERPGRPPHQPGLRGHQPAHTDHHDSTGHPHHDHPHLHRPTPAGTLVRSVPSGGRCRRRTFVVLGCLISRRRRRFAQLPRPTVCSTAA